MTYGPCMTLESYTQLFSNYIQRVYICHMCQVEYLLLTRDKTAPSKKNSALHTCAEIMGELSARDVLFYLLRVYFYTPWHHMPVYHP